MDPHAFISPLQAKAIEYLIAVGYLLLFVPFWKYLDGPRPRRAALRAAPRAAGGWFGVPADLEFHPGHAWARLGADGVVTVGADEFAYKLVAPSRMALPAAGEDVRQGEPAWRFGADGHDVGLLAPLSGTVTELNRAVLAAPETAARDPYGTGWLMKVRPARLDADRRQLLQGPAARKWMESVVEALRASMGGSASLAMEDGGAPVAGLARALDAEHWSDVARRFLRS